MTNTPFDGILVTYFGLMTSDFLQPGPCKTAKTLLIHTMLILRFETRGWDDSNFVS